ncbi:MAG TPA: alpha/beta fold hydrolase [Burkholderiales bacterium]|nr:alpha/beta fold hydrolase [Burkholderiales bacterium]
MPKTVVLIHGAWLAPESWDLFRKRYEAQGYACLTPAWPFQDRPIADQRRAPLPDLGQLTIGKIVDHHETLIRALPEPPILIGHSFGGLFVQMLLDRGLGAVGVAIDPAPPRGVLPTLTVLYGALPVFTAWSGWSRALTLTLPQLAWSFMHLASPEKQRAAYEQYVIPTPGRIYYQAAFGIGSAVNFSNDERAPVLLIAGEQDRTVAMSMVEATFRKHQRAPAVTEYKMFPGRMHWLIAGQGWEEIADYAIQWAARHARADAKHVPPK